MASGSSDPNSQTISMAFGYIIQVLGRPRYGLYCPRVKFRAHSHSSDIQVTFKLHSGDIHDTFRGHSRDIQGTFMIHSGDVQKHH